MYTLDANVFNRSADERDSDYGTCHALLAHLQAAHVPIIAPIILLAEIAGPLRRFWRDPIRARLYTESVAALPNLTLDGDVLQRAGGGVTVQTPAQALAALAAP